MSNDQQPIDAEPAEDNVPETPLADSATDDAPTLMEAPRQPSKAASKATDAPRKDDSALRSIRGEVMAVPTVRRNSDGIVTSMAVTLKVPFKGMVVVKARGDIASAYWSVTPGMVVLAKGVEDGPKEYRAESFEVMAGAPKG